MALYTVKPTLDTNAYTTGDVLGSILTLKGAIAREALLNSIVIVDVDNEGIQIDFVFFDSEPTGTYTNNAAAAIDAADTSKVVGHVSVLTTDYIAVGTDKIGHKAPANLQIQGRATDDLYVLAIARGTPTFAAATDLTFKFGIIPV